MSSSCTLSSSGEEGACIITLIATGFVIAPSPRSESTASSPAPTSDRPPRHLDPSVTAPEHAEPGYASATPSTCPARTNDPETYVRAVAEGLFDWDTFTLLTPADHRGVLIEDADPSGTETPGPDLRPRQLLPVRDNVARSRRVSHHAAPRDRPGVRARAVGGSDRGIRGPDHRGHLRLHDRGQRQRRAGVWYDDPCRPREHPVAFTVFLSCKPVFDRCHLLRLSELDNPLR